MAIVSKAVFEKLAKAKGGAELGDVLNIDRYASTHATLETLGDGGSLFLVTVRPPDEQLWLVGVLEDPELRDGGWFAKPSTLPITDVSSAKSKLTFTTGTGITAKPGALGMSLQTPRGLTTDDEALLRGGKASKKAKPAPAAEKSPKARPATAPKTVRKPDVAKSAKAARKPDVAKPASSAKGDLGAVRAALDDGNGATALTAALAAWSTAKSTGLADLIDAISKQISPPPLEEEIGWTKLAVSKDPVALGALLPSITSLPASFLPRAMELLSAFPDDPRIAKAAQAWILDPPTRSTSTAKFWTHLLRALPRIGDRRLVAACKKRLKLPMVERQDLKNYASKNKPSQFWPKFYASLETLIATLEAQPKIADDKSLDKLGKLAGKLDEVASHVPAPAKRGTAPKLEGPPLAQAVAHANAGRVVDAIDAMLVAWREVRAPELADAIDRANRLLPGYHQAFPVEAKAAHAAWEAAFAADPATAMPQLLHHVTCGGTTAAEHQVMSLATLPDDPRIALRLAEVACLFTVGPQRTQYWKVLWETYARTGDTRANAALRRHFRDFTGTYYDHHLQGRRIVGDFVLTATPPAPADHKALNEMLAAIARLEAKQDRTERDFIAAIVKEWSDEGPRLVYADWLSERGHPRGEAIVLACKAAREKLSPAEQKRLSALRGGFRSPTHVYGPFSDVDFDADRGMPVALNPDHAASAITWRHVAGDPLLATVATITLHDPKDDRGQPSAEDLAPVLLDPTATRLARLVGPSVPLAAELEPLIGKQWKRDGKDYVRR